MSSEARIHAAKAQNQLVAALVAGGPTPLHFDHDDLRAVAHSLLAKRYRQVQLAWPDFIDAFGDKASELFAEFARQSLLSVPTLGWIDGYRFARWLLVGQRLPDVCRIILMRAELQGISHPRRGCSLQLGWLRERNRPLVGLKLPGCKPWILPRIK